MKSRTSFFNTTVLRKDITRFAPVWGLYTIGIVLFLLVPELFSTADNKAYLLADSMTSMSMVNLIFGGISALMVFGDLFKTRLCYATHALPLRREGWFLTHFTAGMLFSFVPNLLLALLYMTMLRAYWYLALMWLAVVTMQYLFFFGAGAFCCLCAGNRLGAVASYLILHFTLQLVGWYAEEVYTPLLYGVEFNWEFLSLFTPASTLPSMEYVDYTTRPFQLVQVYYDEWLYLGIMALTGAGLAALAMLIYRKRNLENAGDFLSLPAAKPVFLLVYTLAVGYLLCNLVSPELLGMFIGLLIGFFTGKMLLNRTVRVFRGWNFLQFGILVTVVALSVGLTALDPAGLTRRVPETDNIEVMYFYDSSHSYQYQNSSDGLREIRDAAEIERFRQFHTEIADGRYRDPDEDVPYDQTTTTVYLQYELKNGSRVLRCYEIPVETTHGEFVRKELSDWQFVFQTNDWEAFAGNVRELEMEIRTGEEMGSYTLYDQTQIQGLLEAMKADCEAGNMAQTWSLHQDEEAAVWVYFYDYGYYDSASEMVGDVTGRVYRFSLNIYESCEHSLAYLDSLNLEIVPYGK